MPLTELILVGTAVVQGLLLVGPRGDSGRKAAELVSLAGLALAALALVFTRGGQELQPAFQMLAFEPLFSMPRAALLFAGMLLGRIVVRTGELPAGRKPEVLFLLTVLCFLCDMLLLSRHLTLSCILLVLCSWVGLFLGGLAYRGRREGEAVLKFWMQASLALTVGFGSVVLLSLVAGGAHFSVIGEYARSRAVYSPQTLLVVAGLFLPFLMAGGFFPFHFIAVDRDHGLPWSIQAVLSVLFQGTVAVAAWKMGVEVFGRDHDGGFAEGLRLLQLCGLAGGFWLAIFALSQENSKRLFSALIGAQWSAVLAAGALPTLLSAMALVYTFSATFIWTALLAFVWSRFQENAGKESMAAVYGAARAYRTSGLILLVALASPLFVPGFPGFPALLYLLAALIEQKSLGFLAAYAVLLSLLCLICIRIGTDLLFRRTAAPEGSENSGTLYYGALDWSVIAGLSSILLLAGFFWHPTLVRLGEAARLFLP